MPLRKLNKLSCLSRAVERSPGIWPGCVQSMYWLEIRAHPVCSPWHPLRRHDLYTYGLRRRCIHYLITLRQVNTRRDRVTSHRYPGIYIYIYIHPPRFMIDAFFFPSWNFSSTPRFNYHPSTWMIRTWIAHSPPPLFLPFSSSFCLPPPPPLLLLLFFFIRFTLPVRLLIR